ncbi:MAG: HPF/RaiA family ribosome-associated protein [Bacteroidota bacterium]
MDIIIQSLGFNAGESLERFIREKVSGLKSDAIVRANVTLFLGPPTTPENNYCEIRLEVPGNDHFVKKQSQYFETSVSECVDVLTQMIKKNRDKNMDRRHVEAIAIQDAALEASDAETEPELEDVVK